MLSRTQKHLRVVEDQMQEHADAAEAVIKKAEDDNRDRSDDENAEIAEHQKAMRTLRDNKRDLEEQKDIEEEVQRTADKNGDGDGVKLTDGLAGIEVKPTASIGEQFVQSEGYKQAIAQVKSAGGIPRGFTTGQIELRGKGTLLEGTGASPGTGGAIAAAVPQVVPGVTDKLFQRLTVADLIPSATTNTNTLRYVVEGTATSAAAGVAEAGTKPESTLALSTVDEPVRKIATALTVSDEMLEDAAQTQGYINGRLSLFVQIEEERQLMVGGGGNDLAGITGRSGVTTWARGTVDNNAVALFKAMNGQRGSSFLEPSAIVMNPANWQTTRLLADTAGQFFGGGPFQGPYGSGSNLQQSGQVTGAADNIWGLPVVVTSAIGSGTAFVGAFNTAAQVYRRSGVTVEATNAHDTYFLKNLVAIRAEERLALAVYRPAAFTLVTGLS